jgi:hypothetical protein
MFALLPFFLALLSSLFKSKSRLEAENAALRRQVIVLQRKVRGRVHFMNSDRLFLIQLYRWFPSVLKVITIIRPETVVRWHRAGFRRYESLFPGLSASFYPPSSGRVDNVPSPPSLTRIGLPSDSADPRARGAALPTLQVSAACSCRHLRARRQTGSRRLGSPATISERCEKAELRPRTL